MDKEELRIKIEQNIDYVRRNVPPDDIYLFCEQTFMAALFFLHKWSAVQDIIAEGENDPIIRKWVGNILKFQACRDKNIDIQLDLNMSSLDQEELL